MYIPEYITGVRIGKAQEYLLNSDLPIGSVALDVGYNNFSYFSKNFRDIVGCTPNEYRRKNAKPGIG
jgi:two-component system response regulator YesN